MVDFPITDIIGAIAALFAIILVGMFVLDRLG